MPVSTYGVMTSIDYSKEKGTTRIYSADNAAFQTIVTEIQNAQYADTLSATQFTTKDLVTNQPPSNVEAQREQKFLIKYIDNVTQRPYELTIPCVDKSTVDFVPNTDQVLFDRAAVAPYSNAMDGIVIALEGSAVSQDGNAITVTEVLFVGRNS